MPALRGMNAHIANHYGQLVFSHPDYTVGAGISPAQALQASRAVTAGRGFAPRPEDMPNIMAGIGNVNGI